jgi:L-amino acid N-acyltransferase YncA
MRALKAVLVRDMTEADRPAVWAFLRAVLSAGETFPYDRGMSESDARALWLLTSPARTVVAVTEDGTIAGTANMYANRAGGGSHVASGSLMVDPDCWGRGVGRR